MTDNGIYFEGKEEIMSIDPVYDGELGTIHIPELSDRGILWWKSRHTFCDINLEKEDVDVLIVRDVEKYGKFAIYHKKHSICEECKERTESINDFHVMNNEKFFDYTVRLFFLKKWFP